MIKVELSCHFIFSTLQKWKEGLIHLVLFDLAESQKAPLMFKYEYLVVLQITDEIGSNVAKLFAISCYIYIAPFSILEI